MNKEYRNHPCTIIINIIKSLKRYIPFVILVLIKLEKYKPIAIAGVTLILIVENFLKWKTTKFSIKEGMLNYKRGIISKEKLSIPIDKIATVDLGQNIFERIFNAYKVKIDSGSLSLADEGSEIDIVLKKRNAFVLREIIRNKDINYDINSISEDDFKIEKYDEEESIEKLKVQNKELFMSALTANNLAYGIGLLFAAQEVLKKIEDILEINIVSKVANYADVKSVYNHSTIYILYCVVALMILFLLFSVIFSVIGTIIKYYNFNVYRKNNTIIIEYGLFSKKSYSLPVENVHAIKLKQNLIKQKFNLCRMEISTVGYGDESKEEAILYPIASIKKAKEIIDTLLPELNYEGEINKAPKEAMMKFMFIPTIVTLIICSIVSIIKIKFSFVFIILPIVILNRYLNYINVGIGFNNDIVACISKGFGKETIYIKVSSIQSISKSSNYFQRKKGVCTYRIDFHSAKIIDIAEMKNLKECYFRQLESKIDF